MTKSVPDRPRRDYVKKAARTFLLSSEQDSLPVDVKVLFKPPSYLLYDVAQAEHITQMSIPIEFWNNDTVDALTCYFAGVFITIYKTAGRTLQRIRFSIAHELGHIVLNHLTEFEQPNSFSIFNSHAYHVLEREADMFAAELLAPTPLLKEMGLLDVANIQRVCDISESAADITISDLNLDLNVSETDRNAVLRKFHRFLFTNEYNKKLVELICPNCRSKVQPESHFCHICGKNITTRLHGSPRTFSKPQTTRNGRLLFCTQCGNDSFRGGQAQCHKCGQPLYNKCTEPEHKKLLSGSARYCSVCGRKTTYFESGILSDWTKDILIREHENNYFRKSKDGLPLSSEWHYWVHSVLINKDYKTYEFLKNTEAILDENDLIIFANQEKGAKQEKLPVNYIRTELMKYCDLDIVSVTVEEEEC